MTLHPYSINACSKGAYDAAAKDRAAWLASQERV